MNYDELSARWKDFPTDAKIYRVVDIESLDDIEQLAVRVGFGISGESSWNEVGPVLELENGRETFAVFRPSRAVQYVDSARWQLDDGSSIRITDEDAIAAANRHLDRLELGAESEFRSTRVTRLHVSAAEKGDKDPQVRVVDVGVVYSRVLDGIVVEGQGGKIVMYLDSNFDLTGFERTSRDVEEAEPVTGWRALAEVEDHWNVKFGETLFVDDARLCYVELGRLEDQSYIQPAYALSLRLPRHAFGQDRTVEEYVVAAINSPGPLLPTNGAFDTTER